MIILSACNRKFERFVIPLMHSVLKNTKHNIRIDFLNDLDRDEEGRRDYTANYRIEMFRSCPPGEHMLWLDADSLVRAPLDELEKILNEFDTLAIRLGEWDHQGIEHYWSVSTVGISGTTRGQVFLDEWEKQYNLVKDKWYPSIMTCQYAYAMAVMASKEYRVKEMSWYWADRYMRENSAIWQAQGTLKELDGNYKRELEIYKCC